MYSQIFLNWLQFINFKAWSHMSWVDKALLFDNSNSKMHCLNPICGAKHFRLQNYNLSGMIWVRWICPNNLIICNHFSRKVVLQTRIFFLVGDPEKKGINPTFFSGCRTTGCRLKLKAKRVRHFCTIFDGLQDGYKSLSLNQVFFSKATSNRLVLPPKLLSQIHKCCGTSV